MPYIDRDETGQVKGLYGPKQFEGQEFLEDGAAEVIAYRTPSYKILRAAEYPPAANYLDGIVKGDTAQVQKYINDCLAVKAKYPKV